MRKIYVLLACICTGFLLHAQNTAPSVNFSFAVSANTVIFTNTSSNLGEGIKKAFWSFGDGTSATRGAYDSISHHYASAGTYQVCLKIYRYPTAGNDSLLIGSECKSITLQQSSCSADFQWIAYGQIVRFSGIAGSSLPIVQVCWNFGDGHDTCFTPTSSTSLLVYHTYAQAGNYTACLKIKYDGGCVAEKCNAVTVPSTTAPDSCSANFSINPITATPLGRRFVAQPWHNNQKKPVRICWTFGDGKDTCIQYTTTYTGDYSIEHRYANYGQYQVCVTIKYDGGCEKQRCNAVAVTQPSNECSFDLSEAAVNAGSLERRFYVGLMPNRTAEKICWNFGDGSDTCVILTSPLNPQQLMIVHHYPGPGNYTVCAKVTYAGGCTAERCRAVSIVLAHSNVCGGYMTDSAVNLNTVHFKGTGIQNAGDYVVSYNWTFGDGTTGSGQSVNHSFGSPGRYTVCLYLKTNTGCETRICNPIGVSGNNQPQLVLTPNPVVNVLNAMFVSLFQQTVTVKIYNANGLVVRSYARVANVGTNNWAFSDVGTLPTGVYSMIVQSSNQFATAIFFKQ